MTLAARLPEYPWDELAPIAEKARAFPGGAVNLSVGTPVDPVPAVIQDALAAAANAPGYPLTAGTRELRAAAAGWLARSLDVHVDPVTVLPVIGTKEFIAWLPTMLGLTAGDTVLYPHLAYPTYDIGARLAGAAAIGVDDLAAGAVDAAPASTRLRWVNSPSNPTGRVLPAGVLRSAVAWARARGAVLASDECYIGLGWDVTPVSALHESVRGDSLDGLLAVFSLSKRSNLAGYRAGFVTGDPGLMKELLLIGRQGGMIVPQPVQAAMTAALSDDAHADEQKARYGARRAVLADGLTAAGFRIEHSEAGLYLWATRPGLDCWGACELLATECGILVGPGSMYGPAGAAYIRVALTETDERVAAAGERLRALAHHV
ncbi:MAG TPA: succinyldiaminopimelate transaminase [Trebonia sp.]|nr:succinyldiaminopimelate transaminase [Trebonia sp.]